MGCYGIVYCATSKSSGKSYVGQTISGLAARRESHESRNAPGLGMAIRTQGTADFSWEVLAEAGTAAELNLLEGKFIDKLETLAPNGYNLVGGRGNISEKTDSPNEWDALHAALNDANTREMPSGLTVEEQASLRVGWRIEAMQGTILRHLEIIGDKWVPIEWSDDEPSDS